MPYERPLRLQEGSGGRARRLPAVGEHEHVLSGGDRRPARSQAARHLLDADLPRHPDVPGKAGTELLVQPLQRRLAEDHQRDDRRLHQPRSGRGQGGRACRLDRYDRDQLGFQMGDLYPTGSARRAGEHRQQVPELQLRHELRLPAVPADVAVRGARDCDHRQPHVAARTAHLQDGRVLQHGVQGAAAIVGHGHGQFHAERARAPTKRTTASPTCCSGITRPTRSRTASTTADFRYVGLEGYVQDTWRPTFAHDARLRPARRLPRADLLDRASSSRTTSCRTRTTRRRPSRFRQRRACCAAASFPAAAISSTAWSRRTRSGLPKGAIDGRINLAPRVRVRLGRDGQRADSRPRWVRHLPRALPPEQPELRRPGQPTAQLHPASLRRQRRRDFSGAASTPACASPSRRWA